MRVIRRAMPSNIEIRIEQQEALEPIHADAGQLQQALLNLCLHAKEAMAQGGVLTVSTAMMTIDERQVTVRPETKPGQFTALQVSHTGLQSVVEGSDQGGDRSESVHGDDGFSEFGLATVYQIIREHAGWIETRTNDRGGATVTVYLPVAEARALHVAEAREMGSESILVVAREQMVVGFIKTILEQRGYQVETADGEEVAIDALSRRAGEFSAAIIDSESGDKGRLKILDGLRKVNPGLHAVVISGGSPSEVMMKALESPLTTFLQKPFKATDLSRSIRLLLDREPIES